MSDSRVLVAHWQIDMKFPAAGSPLTQDLTVKGQRRLAAVLYSSHEAQSKALNRAKFPINSLPFSLILNTIAIDVHILKEAEAPMESDASAQFFDIEVRVLNPVSGEYPIEITLEDGAVARGSMPLDALTWESSGDTQKDGQRLFNILLGAGRLREAWGATRSKQRRIRLRIDPPELHALPWELLHDGRAMLSASASTPFSRYLPVDLPWGQPTVGQPVRVLAVISNPTDLETKYNLTPVNVEVEEQLLRKALSGEGVALDMLAAPVTLKRLEEKLREGYHVFHLIAHGAFNVKRQQAAVYLQANDGTGQRVVDDDLVAMLARLPNKPALLVLATCQSATRSMRDEFVGLGPKLVQAGMPAVVAMQDFVSIATARQFSVTLYDQLLRYCAIDWATNQARSTLLTGGRPDAAVPVLFMRLKDGQLWKSFDSVRSAAIDTTDLAALRKLIITNYSLEEIRTLCSDIGVDYDNLGGEGKEAKARELIAYLNRRNKVDDLVRYIQKNRGR